MREREFWQDNVLSESGKFIVKEVKGLTDVFNISPYGIVMQAGTFQDAAHFNSIEEGLTASEIAASLAVISAGQNRASIYNHENSLEKLFSVETGTVTLNNTMSFPFNNSLKTVALIKKRDNTDYVVVFFVKNNTGNVGDVFVSEQLINGFKIEYTGSAANVKIDYKIIGGWDK